MAEPLQQPASRDECYFSSEDCDLLEIREEDTQPGTVSERYRKMLQEKYRRKTPPSNDPAKES